MKSRKILIKILMFALLIMMLTTNVFAFNNVDDQIKTNQFKPVETSTLKSGQPCLKPPPYSGIFYQIIVEDNGKTLKFEKNFMRDIHIRMIITILQTRVLELYKDMV